MLAEIFAAFGIASPLATVVEFGLVVLAVGKMYDLAKGYFEKK